MDIKKHGDNSFGDVLINAAEQALEHAKGARRLRKTMVEIRPVPNYSAVAIKRIRENLSLSQWVFGGVLGVSAKTVEAWETGTRIPGGSARRLLSELDTNPEYINKVLMHID